MYVFHTYLTYMLYVHLSTWACPSRLKENVVEKLNKKYNIELYISYDMSIYENTYTYVYVYTPTPMYTYTKGHHKLHFLFVPWLGNFGRINGALTCWWCTRRFSAASTSVCVCVCVWEVWVCATLIVVPLYTDRDYPHFHLFPNVLLFD